MTRFRKVMIGASGLAFLAAAALAEVPMSELVKLFTAPLGAKGAAVMFLSYSGVIVRTPTGTFAIDPANLLVDADIAVLKKNGLKAVLYTHGHSDHFVIGTAQALARETGAVIVAEPTVAADLKAVGGIQADKIVSAAAGRDIQIAGLTVHAVAGKHIGPIMLYRVQIGSVSFFHGGDSAYIPVGDCRADIAFLPTGKPSPTASPEAALKMAQDVKPQVALLMHGDEAQHTAFAKLAAKELPKMSVDVLRIGTVRILSLR
jgi:L-ascorbate metabolism protein UlaG (beta-lactamase superfamily)